MTSGATSSKRGFAKGPRAPGSARGSAISWDHFFGLRAEAAPFASGVGGTRPRRFSSGSSPTSIAARAASLRVASSPGVCCAMACAIRSSRSSVAAVTRVPMLTLAATFETLALSSVSVNAAVESDAGQWVARAYRRPERELLRFGA